MTRSYIGRVVGTFVVALGMLLGLFAASAAAQVVDRAPASQIQAADNRATANVAGSASSASVGAAYYECGFYRNPYEGWDAYYTHCGRAISIKIRVSFNYGMVHRDIWVWGTHNLSRHPELQGAGAITGAWCIREC